MQDAALKVAVVSADAPFRSTVAEVLRQHPDLASVVSDTAAAPVSLNTGTIDRLQSETAEVVIVDLSGDPAAGMRMLRLLGDSTPGRTILATGPTLAPELLMEGMRSGITEYLPMPVSAHDLADALRRAGRRVGRGYAQPANGRMFSVLGAKGGTGVTTVAANAALCMHRPGQRTLLVDLNLESGNLALVMGLSPRFSVADLIENLHRVDESLLSSLIVQHESGVSLLAAPPLPQSSPTATADQARAILRLLRNHYDLLVVDLARPYSEFGRSALDVSESVLLVLVPDVLAIHGAKRLLPLLRKSAEGRAASVEVVLNRVAPGDEVQKSDVQEALDVSNVHVLRREDDSMVSAVNVGKPLLSRNGKRSRYVRDMQQLCATMVAAEANSQPPAAGVRRLLHGLTRRANGPGVKK